MEMEKIKGRAKANASWARLIHKIFDAGCRPVDPLLCPNCGKEMKIIAFITNHQEIKKILKHIGAGCRPEETQSPPPLPSIPADELEDSYDFGEDFPPDEVYFADQEWEA